MHRGILAIPEPRQIEIERDRSVSRRGRRRERLAPNHGTDDDDTGKTLGFPGKALAEDAGDARESGMPRSTCASEAFEQRQGRGLEPGPACVNCTLPLDENSGCTVTVSCCESNESESAGNTPERRAALSAVQHRRMWKGPIDKVRGVVGHLYSFCNGVTVQGQDCGIAHLPLESATLYAVGSVEDWQRIAPGQSRACPYKADNWSTDSIGRQAGKTDVAKQAEEAESHVTEYPCERRTWHGMVLWSSEAGIGDESRVIAFSKG